MEIITRRASKKLTEVKHALNVLGFDELNVLQAVTDMYAWLYDYVKERFIELYGGRFEEVYKWLNGQLPPDDIIDTLVALEITGLLEEPNPVAHYAFSSEFYRKRDRAIEAVQSCPTKAQKQIELQKQMKYVLQQIAWYNDFVSQDAEIHAFEESGVEKVKRHEVMDRRTCGTCRDANGDIYPIKNIPPIPHLRCRRWFTPV